MKAWHRDGRLYEPRLEATAHRFDDMIELRSPAVGLWRGRPPKGTIVAPGAEIGEIEILGVLHRVLAPLDAAGVVTTDAPTPRPGELPLAWGDTMLVLDPEGAAVAGEEAVAAARGQTTASQQGLVFPSPLSGRFYARPAPDKPPFVAVGDTIQTGQTVALLEVMKTFNRITYGGSGLPDRAKILQVVPADGDDIDAGDALLRLEPQP